MKILKNLIVPKKKEIERGTLWVFLTYILLQNIKKLEGGPFEDIENVSQCRKKNERRDPLVSSGFCRIRDCLKEKQKITSDCNRRAFLLYESAD